MEELVRMVEGEWGDPEDVDEIPTGLDFNNLIDIVKRVEFLERQLALNDYEPAFDLANFSNRLSQWLAGAEAGQDKFTMLRLLFSIIYLGKLDYDSLYRAALGSQVTPWLIDDGNISFSDENIDRAIKTNISSTCFSAATDSMRINAFHTVNNIGNDFRPEWRSIMRATDGCGACTKLVNGLRAYLESEAIQRIVVLEDFVGTLTQSEKILDFVASLGLPVLFVPLVICYQGDIKAKEIAVRLQNLEYAPTLRLSEDVFINNEIANLSATFEAVAELIQRLHPRIIGKDVDWQNEADFEHSPFGKYNTGAIFAKYTNCPNNTLPIIHSSSSSEWTPLFPRSSRIEVK